MVCARETNVHLDGIGGHDRSLLVISHAKLHGNLMTLGHLYDFGVANRKGIAGGTFLPFQSLGYLLC
ncbi:MAG: hypothetical protein AMXMBFR7_12190 [Planctomycetota bacterium]